jgi:Lar family restriction alleviation protein
MSSIENMTGNFREKHHDIKPCPFCGSDDLSIREDSDPFNDEFYGFFIECLSCGASSGTGPKVESAYMLWQTRSAKHEE